MKLFDRILYLIDKKKNESFKLLTSYEYLIKLRKEIQQNELKNPGRNWSELINLKDQLNKSISKIESQGGREIVPAFLEELISFKKQIEKTLSNALLN